MVHPKFSLSAQRYTTGLRCQAESKKAHFTTPKPVMSVELYPQINSFHRQMLISDGEFRSLS
jgi:hypothetical protein